MKKILVVEAPDQTQAEWIQDSPGKFLVIRVASIQEAYLALAMLGDTDIIVMTACVPHAKGDPKPQTPNTPELVKVILDDLHFGGIMVAVSILPAYRALLMQAGCHYNCDRDNAIRVINAIIDA